MISFHFPVVLGMLALGQSAPAANPAPMVVSADRPNEIAFPPARARLVRFVIHASMGGPPCIDELEIYGPGGKQNLALAAAGGKASASSCLPGYAIHQIANLNDGRYGNSHSWIAATDGEEWAQIELPQPAEIAKVVFSRDRLGGYKDRLPADFEVRLSLDGQHWTTVRRLRATGWSQRAGSIATRRTLPEPFTWEGALRYAFLCERDTWEHMSREDHLSPFQADRPALPGGTPYWATLAAMGPLDRVLRQMDDMIGRFAARGLDVAAERAELAGFRRRQAAMPPARHDPEGDSPIFVATTQCMVPELGQSPGDLLYFDARQAKRRLMLRDPELAPLEKVLFVKRHPYAPSHNYSDVLDSAFRSGGGICVLGIPRVDGRLEPAEGKVTMLFDAARGIARDPAADFDAARIYFAYRPADRGDENAYWHLMVMDADGSGLRQLSRGPVHDYYPCPLPDGRLAFISTRCRCRFLCWRPQAFVLFRMDADGSNIVPVSFANLSEWAPAVMHDGRILWTRSEYIDKGADFGHTLWAVHPDGDHPQLLFGNNTTNCYMNAHDVPGTSELCCTLISHGGDLNGPVGLIDAGRGPFAADAVTNITPDVQPHYHMSWASRECFRDPVPLSRDYFLVSHAPADRFGLYVIDRYGNRELLALDPAIGSMSPTPLRPAARPLMVSSSRTHHAPRDGSICRVGTAHQSAGSVESGDRWAVPTLQIHHAERDEYESELCPSGQFAVADVYRGLEPAVARGRVKYLRVCQEVRSDLDQLPDGQYRRDHNPFQDFYASPSHKVTGPYGWPTYVAKAALGIVPVEEDGSANFIAPAGKVLYFELLDADFNEVQRMRSVVQLQPGERRSCIGCHEGRTQAPPVRPATALRQEPRSLEPPPWGDVPFSYQKVVQPVWNARCVGCHNAQDRRKIDLTGTLDADRIPASYRTLISQGWVHYFDMTWGREHHEAAPLSFGTVKSRLWKLLDAGHYGVRLSREETHRVKCWIDLNCPLWPDYRFRPDRPASVAASGG